MSTKTYRGVVHMFREEEEVKLDNITVKRDLPYMKSFDNEYKESLKKIQDRKEKEEKK